MPDNRYDTLLIQLEDELLNSTLRIHKGGQMPIIPDLKELGAEGIIEYPLNKIVL